jgi:hypothetical protein
MNEYCRLAYVALFLAAIMSPAAACTQGESEDKMRDAIYAVEDLRVSNPAKAASAAKKINQALEETLQPSSNPQVATDRLCKALDEVLAELRR